MQNSKSREGEEAGSHRIDTELVLAHLKRVLDSPAFRGSRRSSSFLEFVVDRALASRWDDLKERTIAVAVFNRPADVDLTEDTIVRVGAREVRKRLAQYYMSHETAGDGVRIDLTAGTYVPHFRMPAVELPAAPVETPAKVEAALVPAVRSRSWESRLAVLGAVALVIVVATTLMTKRSSADEAATFWKPALESGSNVIIGVAHPVVYQPSLDSWTRETAKFSGNLPTIQAPFEFPESELKGGDMMRVKNQFVGFGDLVAIGDLTTFLTQQKRSTRFRLASNIEFSDMREGAVVLVGAFTNRWTTELTQKLKFHFKWGEGMSPQIEESGSGRVWAVPPGLSDPTTQEDYFMITRIVNSPTGKPVLILGGLKQAGTEAAGHLTTSPDELRKILKPLPQGWQNHNLQLILHTRVVGGRPSEFEVVAYHMW